MAEIIVYADSGFGGGSLAVPSSQNFGPDWIDRISSIDVQSGIWRLKSEHDRVMGDFAPGRYGQIEPNDMCRAVELMLPEGDEYGLIVIHTDISEKGDGNSYRADVSWLAPGFDQTASSLRVIAGEWDLYEGVAFQGYMGHVVAGQYVPALEPNDRLRSMRLVKKTKPA